MKFENSKKLIIKSNLLKLKISYLITVEAAIVNYFIGRMEDKMSKFSTALSLELYSRFRVLVPIKILVPWVSHGIYLSFNFLICRMIMIICALDWTW